MSTKLHDLASQAELRGGAGPQTFTSTVTGSGVDMIHADGRCFAVQHVGTVSGTSPILDGKIQESDAPGSGYTDIAGAAFTSVTASNNLQIISFTRSKRYLRYVGTIAGTSPSFTLAVLLGGQKKRI